jgi:chromosomal replication initiator protein
VTFARVVATIENRLAVAALHDLADSLRLPVAGASPGLVFLYGPPGAGKTLLLNALESEIYEARLKRNVLRIRCDEFDHLVHAADPLDWQRLVGTDLMLFDDVHLLHVRSGEERAVSGECLVRLLDERQALDRTTVLTSTRPPGELGHLSARLTGRLASGVMVSIPAMGASSRLLLLEKFAQHRQLVLSPAVTAWLAENLTGSGRELEGAIIRLHELARLTKRPLDVDTVQREFRPEVESRSMTVEHIAERVGDYFRVDARQLQSRRRFAGIQTPRQVSMYLVRRLTNLSLAEIGKYFGGRDHSTVLHACRKIERTLNMDCELSSAVQQLHSILETTLCNGRH